MASIDTWQELELLLYHPSWQRIAQAAPQRQGDGGDALCGVCFVFFCSLLSIAAPRAATCMAGIIRVKSRGVPDYRCLPPTDEERELAILSFLTMASRTRKIANCAFIERR